MCNQTRTQRRRLMREAEGFLELAVLFDDQLPLEQELKDVLADRCIRSLQQIGPEFQGQAGILYLSGQAHRLAQRFDRAIDLLELSWQADETNLHTCLALGWCYKRTHRLGKAVEALKRALDVESDSGIVHYNLACYLALMRRTRQAIKHLSLALDINEEFRGFVGGEKDFDSIRQDPEFQAITSVIV